MSSEGNWLKRKGKQTWTWGPYVVAERPDGWGLVATRSGDNPETVFALGYNPEDLRAVGYAHTAARAACENHRLLAEPGWEPGRLLVWVADEEEEEEAWIAPGLPYRCSWDTDCEGTLLQIWAHHGEEALGRFDDGDCLGQAQAACQAHLDARRAELAAEETPELARVQHGGQRLVTRVVMCQLSEEERGERAEEALALEGEADELRELLAEELQRHKAERKRLREQIATKADAARAVRVIWACAEEPREREVYEQLGPPPANGGPREIVFYDPATGAELERRPVTAEELQARLPGVENGPEEVRQSEAEQGPAGQQRIVNGALILPGPAVKALPEPEPVEELPPLKPLEWRRITIDGRTCYVTANAYVSGKVMVYKPDDDHYLISTTDAGLRQVICSIGGRKRALPDTHTTVKDAKAEAALDNRTRPRWGKPSFDAEGEPYMMLSRCGQYQLQRMLGPRDLWEAKHLGGQDELGENLGEHQGLAAAQLAAEEHAARRPS